MFHTFVCLFVFLLSELLLLLTGAKTIQADLEEPKLLQMHLVSKCFLQTEPGEFLFNNMPHILLHSISILHLRG